MGVKGWSMEHARGWRLEHARARFSRFRVDKKTRFNDEASLDFKCVFRHKCSLLCIWRDIVYIAACNYFKTD